MANPSFSLITSLNVCSRILERGLTTAKSVANPSPGVAVSTGIDSPEGQEWFAGGYEDARPELAGPWQLVSEQPHLVLARPVYL